MDINKITLSDLTSRAFSIYVSTLPSIIKIIATSSEGMFNDELVREVIKKQNPDDIYQLTNILSNPSDSIEDIKRVQRQLEVEVCFNDSDNSIVANVVSDVIDNKKQEVEDENEEPISNKEKEEIIEEISDDIVDSITEDIKDEVMIENEIGINKSNEDELTLDDESDVLDIEGLDEVITDEEEVKYSSILEGYKELYDPNLNIRYELDENQFNQFIDKLNAINKSNIINTKSITKENEIYPFDIFGNVSFDKHDNNGNVKYHIYFVPKLFGVHNPYSLTELELKLPVVQRILYYFKEKDYSISLVIKTI